MAIISGSDGRQEPRYINSQLVFTMVCMVITTAVLLFLNLYCSKICQEPFFQSKHTMMVEKAQITASEIGELEVVNHATVSSAIAQLGSLRVTRIIVTDSRGVCVYDSLSKSAVGQYVLLPEVVQALRSNDVFTCHYANSTMESRAAIPVLSGGTLVGSVYMMEYDTTQGALIGYIENAIFSITMVLEVLVFLFSMVYSRSFTLRMRRILNSIRIIRNGDYSHRVAMGGRDELTGLGQEFNALTERLQESEQTRRRFVSDASHELKTPLASIKLLSDSILQNDMDADTVREFVQDIGNEADRLNRMSQKLLSLTRVDSQTDGDCEIVPMAPTVERVVRMLAPVAQERNITITTDLQGDCTILILEDDLYQITFNLVENGIKYNRPGGSLQVSLHREGDDGLLQVSDTGVGIPAESLDHIFQRFYRVDKARSRQSGGSGLGLAIVHDMVARNRGKIAVESTLEVGTTFTVRFPAFDVEDFPEEVEEP